MKLVTVALFESTPEAYAAKAQLEAAGIRAMVMDEELANQLWAGGACNGVKLQVVEDNAERANQVLFAEHRDSYDESPTPWECVACREVIEAEFMACWSCGGDRADVANPSFDPHLVAELAPEREAFANNDAVTDRFSHIDQTNPYAPSAVSARGEAEEIPAASEVIEERALRAWRASVIGLFLCPGALHLYSIWLLLMVGVSGRQLSRAGRRRFLSALAVDLLVLGGWATLLPSVFA